MQMLGRGKKQSLQRHHHAYVIWPGPPQSLLLQDRSSGGRPACAETPGHSRSAMCRRRTERASTATDLERPPTQTRGASPHATSSWSRGALYG
eukprot:6190650-Pleurochrysis_carterae.AAC.2